MPLYVHKSGERKRTVPGSYEDRRVAASPDWELIPPHVPARDNAPAPAEGDAPAGKVK